MTDHRLVFATDEHLKGFAERLCEADRKEAALAYGGDVEGRLALNVKLSRKAFAVLVDGQAEVICGFDGGPAVGSIWALGTEKAHRYPTLWIKYGQMVIAEGLRHCYVLENYISVENTRSIRWLKRLGATFFDPAPYGYNGALFRRFIITGVDENV